MVEEFLELTFEKVNYTATPLARGEYERCRFINCDFSNSSLANIKFLESEFIGCNLSLCKLDMAAFVDVKFTDGKLLGLQFETCDKFNLSIGFDNCILNHSSFFQSKIRKTLFKNTQLIEVDFAESDLTASVFDNCDLSRASFVRCILEKVDFRTSYNYSIDPEINKVKKAKFSLAGIRGLLDKYDIEIV